MSFNFNDAGITLPALNTVENRNDFLDFKIMAKFRQQETLTDFYVIAGNKLVTGDMILYCLTCKGSDYKFRTIWLSNLKLCGARFIKKFQPCKVREVL